MLWAVQLALPMSLGRLVLLGGIDAYRRWLSPRKGWSCAHRAKGGGASCSAHGLRLARRLRGRRIALWQPLMRRQYARCRAAALNLHAAEFHPDQRKDRKRDACDNIGWFGCAPIDLPGPYNCTPDCAPDCTPDCGCGS